MSTSTIELDAARAVSAEVKDGELTVRLEDGRSISIPTVWFPRLHHGTPAEQANLEINPFGIHWPDLDEDISIQSMLLGRKSGESQRSLQKYFEHRRKLDNK